MSRNELNCSCSWMTNYIQKKKPFGSVFLLKAYWLERNFHISVKWLELRQACSCHQPNMLPFFSFLQSNVCCICILPSFGFFSVYGPIRINWRGCDINLEYLILSYLNKRFVVSSIHLSRVIVKANSKHFFSLETFQLWPIFTFPAVISLWLWNKNLWKYSCVELLLTENETLQFG